MNNESSPSHASQWLEIADELSALHGLIYGLAGPFDYLRDTPISPTCLEAAQCIRDELAMPRRNADQRAWLRATSASPLKALEEVIGNDRSVYAGTMTGRLMLEKMRWLRSLINAADAGR